MSMAEHSGTPAAHAEVATSEQSEQENEYWFPYHYVAQFRGTFRHYFLDTWSMNYASTIEFLLGKLAGESRQRIVDIGCGDGRFSRELAMASPASSVVGVDYSKRAVTLASAMNQDLPNLQFLSKDITGDSGLGQFDLAILMEVFEHLPLADADRFMRAVRALVKPGGVLYLTVPHKNKPVEYKHFQHFSVATLLPYLEPYFEIAEVVPFERRGLSRWLLERILSNRLFILNNGLLLTLLYRWYKKSLFRCASEASCQRLFVRAVAK